jgi:hypothetical protein
MTPQILKQDSFRLNVRFGDIIIYSIAETHCNLSELKLRVSISSYLICTIQQFLTSYLKIITITELFFLFKCPCFQELNPKNRWCRRWCGIYTTRVSTQKVGLQ